MCHPFILCGFDVPHRFYFAAKRFVRVSGRMPAHYCGWSLLWVVVIFFKQTTADRLPLDFFLGFFFGFKYTEGFLSTPRSLGPKILIVVGDPGCSYVIVL